MQKLLLVLLYFAASTACAESVALAGMLGSKALLVVNGGAPKTVAAGETHQGVKVISTTPDQAVIGRCPELSCRFESVVMNIMLPF